MGKKSTISAIIILMVIGVVYFLYRAYGGGGASQPILNQTGSVINKAAPETAAPPAPALKPNIKISELPQTVKVGETFNVKWRIEAAEARPIFHTAVHYGSTSPKGDLTVKSYPLATTVHQGTIPDNFSDTVTAAAVGKIYLRAMVIVDGANFWSEEKVVQVTKK